MNGTVSPISTSRRKSDPDTNRMMEELRVLAKYSPHTVDGQRATEIFIFMAKSDKLPDSIRREIICLLGRRSDASVIKLLLELIEHERFFIRSLALTMICTQSGGMATIELLRLKYHHNPRVRRHVSLSLRSRNGGYLNDAFQYINDSQESCQFYLDYIDVIKDKYLEGITVTLMQMAQYSKYPEVRAAALLSLMHRSHRGLIALFKELKSDPDPRVLVALAKVLSIRIGKEAQQILTELFHNTNPSVSQAAQKSLSEFKVSKKVQDNQMT